MDDVDPEGVDGVAADVIPIDSGDQDLPLVVVDEQATDHLGTLPTLLARAPVPVKDAPDVDPEAVCPRSSKIRKQQEFLISSWPPGTKSAFKCSEKVEQRSCIQILSSFYFF